MFKAEEEVKAGRSEPISVNGTHNDPIEREIFSLVSWYRIIKSSKAENCCSLERRSAEVVPIIEVRVWD